MAHRRGAIWTERLLLGLILVSLVGTLNLLLAIHRRAAAERREAVPEKPAVAKTADPGPAPEPSAPVESPAVTEQPAPPPAPPEEDPTQKAIAALATAKAKRARGRPGRRRARQCDGRRVPVGRRRIRSLEAAGDARSPADRRHQLPG